MLFGFAKKTNRKTTKTGWVSVCFGSNRKKINFLEDTLIKICFFEIFSVCFGLFQLFWYRTETPKQTEKKFVWFRETNRKTTETDWVSVRFGSNRKKNLVVSRTPYLSQRLPSTIHQSHKVILIESLFLSIAITFVEVNTLKLKTIM
jgi:hypothetical protein